MSKPVVYVENKSKATNSILRFVVVALPSMEIQNISAVALSSNWTNETSKVRLKERALCAAIYRNLTLICWVPLQLPVEITKTSWGYRIATETNRIANYLSKPSMPYCWGRTRHNWLVWATFSFDKKSSVIIQSGL